MGTTFLRDPQALQYPCSASARGIILTALHIRNAQDDLHFSDCMSPQVLPMIYYVQPEGRVYLVCYPADVMSLRQEYICDAASSSNSVAL